MKGQLLYFHIVPKERFLITGFETVTLCYDQIRLLFKFFTAFHHFVQLDIQQ